MAKPKLCEIIAVVSTKKGAVEKAVTETYHLLQKGDLFDGLSKTYRSRREDGDALPAESKNPQLKVSDIVNKAAASWTELFDLMLTLDTGNCIAKGDINIEDAEGKVTCIAQSLPVSTLLFLAKQLENVQTFVSKIPTPDPAETWTYSSQQDMLTTAPRQTVRTQKVEEVLVLAQATKEHPAQAKTITKDVAAGDWTNILYTTKMPAKQKNEILGRINKLLDAVKIARERANSIEVDKKKMGEAILSFVFSTPTK